jgi:hypothetical protein
MGVVPFSLPADLADACFDRLGAHPPEDIEGAAHLLDRMAATVPTGSTAKLEAVAADQVPPRADPTPVAETWLARPGLAWSCWAVSTLYAALVAHAGALTADVLGARRVDPASVPVDFHSVVEVREVRSGPRRWLTDPYFWISPIEAPVGDTLRPGVWGEAVADGPVWRTAVGSCAVRYLLRYRTFTTALIASDVEGLCRVSVTYTGVATRARAHLATADGVVAASADRDGVVRLRRWRAGPTEVWGVPCETVELNHWADAEHILAEVAQGR